MRKAFLSLAVSTVAAAAVFSPAPAFAQFTPVSVDLNQSYYLNTGRNITRVAIANPKIADVSLLDGTSLNVIGISPGTTTLNVWASNGYRYEYRITVSNQDSGLAKLVQEAIGLPEVRVQMIGGKILLRGSVKNQYERDLAYKIAKMYAQTGGSSGKAENATEGAVNLRGDIDDSVVNMLEMTNPDQINIEAMFVEINSNDAKNLGLNYVSQDLSDTSDSGITMNDAGSYYAGETYGTQRDAGHHWYNQNWLFTHFSKINMQIHALIENGRARIVSRPNITTMSGRDAKILIGGEIPYSTSNSFGSTTTEYREYGIGLDLHAPTVDQDGNITTELETQVSRLDWSNAVTKDGYRMPGIATRSAKTTVNIPSGMTMVIGGLLNSEEAKTLQKVPFFGNLPLIGELFRYHNNSHQKSEIVVLITPRVVNEETPARMSPDMEDTYNASRREVRDMKQVDVNGDIPEKSNEELAKEKKVAEKAQKKAQRAQKQQSAAPSASSKAVLPAANGDDMDAGAEEAARTELPGDRIKASAKAILGRMDK
ncbi:type II and III secretion system protein family protein [Mitsuokella sp. WILCCON 0060]|uniref:type II and III secretion system protein family protein n=1 Tax=unclassified Mitsuokella TaxID=2637239 RepID=UPI003F0B0E63